MIQHETIEIFGYYWWLGNLSTITIITAIILMGIKSNNNYQNIIAKLLGGLSLFRWTFIQLYSAYDGSWVIESSLPLQMCSFSSLFCGIVMFYRIQIFYEFVYFIGIPSAFHAFITPEFTMGTDGYFFFDYYLNHGLIALIPLYLTFVLKFRPRKYSWFTTLIYVQILLIIAGLTNWSIGSNYMYLSEKPIVNNPFVIGEWPWYIFGLQFAGLIHFILLYLPFGIKKNK
jgi:hypothetical integral membrane protein (TIGR02206 family)